MISKNTIDKVFATARVEEVIGEFVQLKKSGSNYKGLSPFSDERTPSFMVSPVKQIWKDFSSGKGGNVVSFLMEHEHYSYPEAVRYLAKKYNIEIEETEQTDAEKEIADKRENLFAVSEYAKETFHKNLLEDENGRAIGLSYFKERGFTLESIKKFQLGYALDEWDAFTNKALDSGFHLNDLVETGLSIVKEESFDGKEKRFDRFKGRVIFPIHSMSGRILGFGGRILSNDKKTAKYVNSPESEIYHKSNILYGIYFAKQQIAKEDNCYLVEGYTDVISLSQNGIENVVSSSGTALTENQIRLISRLTNNITILFDGDDAGIRASIRGIDLILEQGLNVKVILFPDGEDPDSFAKRVSNEELAIYLKEEAQDFINFKVKLLLKESKNDPVKKAGLIRDIVVSISKIPDRIKQEVYIQECSKLMDISEAVLFNELAQLDKRLQKELQLKSKNRPLEQPISPVLEKTPEQQQINELEKYEYEIIRILLLYGNVEVEFEESFVEENIDTNSNKKTYFKNTVSNEIYLNLQEDEIEFSNEKFKEVYYTIINQLHQYEKIAIDSFINHEDDEIAALVTNILMDEEKYSLSDWDRKQVHVGSKESKLAKKVYDAIFNLRRILIDEKIMSLLQENSKDTEVDNSRRDVLEKIVSYTTLKNRIAYKLNRVI